MIDVLEIASFSSKRSNVNKRSVTAPAVVDPDPGDLLRGEAAPRQLAAQLTLGPGGEPRPEGEHPPDGGEEGGVVAHLVGVVAHVEQPPGVEAGLLHPLVVKLHVLALQRQPGLLPTEVRNTCRATLNVVDGR